MRHKFRILSGSSALLLVVFAFQQLAAADGTNSILPTPDLPLKASKSPLGSLDIPEENQKMGKGAPVLNIETAQLGVLINAIAKDKSDDVSLLQFPREAFLALKAIPRPGDYHQKLSEWYAADIHREHMRLKPLGELQLDTFRPGSCRWKAPGTEANKIPYWSCWGSKATVKGISGAKEIITIRAMINWETNGM